MKRKINSILVILIANISFLSAQDNDMSKVVVVESTYRPEIENAEKYSIMPSLTDTARQATAIEYSVLPSNLKTKYNIKTIKPAKLVGSPLDELYNSRLKLGIGNYFTPLAEFSIQNLRSKDYAVGAYAYHKSSHSKLELADGNNVNAGYGKNRINLYGKRFYRGVNVKGDVYLNTDKYRYYGYNTELTPDTALDKKDIRQFYTNIGAKAEIFSTVADSGEFEYRIGLEGSYFGDDYQNRENNLKVPVNFGFNIKSFHIDVDSKYNLYSRLFDSLNSREQIVQVRPMIKKRGEQWEIQFGINTYFTNEAKSDFNFYPEARFRFAVIENVMEAFVGVYGSLEENTMIKITTENPYLKPATRVENTNHKLIGYGGFEGLLSSNSGYRAEVSFNTVENAYFFINDTSNMLMNQFITVSDNYEMIKFSGELWYSPFSFLDFYLKGNYRSYNMASLDKPWQTPSFNMNFRASYNFKEKIYAKLDIIQVGERYAYNFTQPDEPIVLDPIRDLNLGLEYKYSQVLSGFVEFNNLLSKQYYLWNQYPSQKLNVMLGFSYKF